MIEINKKALVAILMALSTLLVSFTAINIMPVKAQPAQLWIEPPSMSATPCTEFMIEVWLDTGEYRIDGFDVWIDISNPSAVSIVSINRGWFVPPSDVFTVDPAPPAGVIHFWDTSVQGNPVDPSTYMQGSGVIAEVWLHCEEIGSTDLNFNIAATWLMDVYGIYIGYAAFPGHIDQEYPPAHTYIQPPEYTVPICVPFTVDVEAQGLAGETRSFSLTLSYTNTPVVDAIAIVPGSLVPAPATIDWQFIDDLNGKIYFDVTGASQFGPSGTTVDGTIATITFHCTGAGESLLNIDQILYYDGPQQSGNLISSTSTGGRVIQYAYWEPIKLQHIVEWPGIFAYIDIPYPYFPLGYQEPPEGYLEIMAQFVDKGYEFDVATATAMEVSGSIEEEEFHGTVTSFWSMNTLEDGTRACMLSAEMDDGSSMAMGFVTNLLAPEQVPEVDPYIIVNAQPYLFVDFYWYAWPTPYNPLGRVIRWPYWWYDSHSHPNWFWGPYWWWRCYTKAYVLGLPYPWPWPWAYWRPWWGWWWHWVYWRHWYWWSSYFPYDP